MFEYPDETLSRVFEILPQGMKGAYFSAINIEVLGKVTSQLVRFLRGVELVKLFLIMDTVFQPKKYSFSPNHREAT